MSKPIKYKHKFTQRVVWGEMDAFGHVNNVTYARYFESARADFFSSVGIWDSPLKPAKTGPVITHLEMDFRKQVMFPATLEVTLEVNAMTSRGFHIVCSMWNERDECVVTAGADIVWFDFVSGRPAIIPKDFSERFGLSKSEI
ncbi:MAG: acyl-CoA thioesterase [Leptospira sp.]|nr:acyl-CoA thioesterase [Leptospira sp.]